MRNLLSISAAAPLLAFPTPYIGHLDAYANTLTGLIPDIYAALDVVSRELVGFIPSVSRAPGAERAAVNENVTYHVAPAISTVNIAPAMTVPEPADVAIGYGSLQITKSKAAPFGFTGEEVKGLNNGVGFQSVQQNLIGQAFRALTNEIELDLSTVATLGASRAYGTAGTTPFASGFGEVAQMKKLLDDNGATPSDRVMILNTTAGAALRTLGTFNKVNEVGNMMGLAQGALFDIHGFKLTESAQLPDFVKGTNSGSTTNTAGYAIGATVITLAAAGTGTIKAGDVITFAGDTNKYMVASGDTDVSNGGTITLAAPGLRVAIPTSATAITTVATHSNNVAFSSDAIHLVTRAPALPPTGDSAVDRMMITDPRSGISFELALYAGYRKMRAELALSWGQKVVKTENVGILLG